MGESQETTQGLEGDSELQTEVLEDLSSAVRYRRWLCDLARPWLGGDPLEVGSGLGDYAAELLGSTQRFTASEADPRRLTALRERFSTEAAVTVLELRLPTDERRHHSSVVSFNVLEHIPDDVEALRSFASLTAPGGNIVLLVPACNAAMSRFDREIGHVRRYSRASLRNVAEEAGLRVEVLHYVNAPGLAAWFVGMRLLRLRPHDGPLLRVWDRVVISAARAIEDRRRPPFGQSLFMVASVPTKDAARMSAEPLAV